MDLLKSSPRGVIRLFLALTPLPPMDDSSPFMSWHRVTKWKYAVPWGQSLICYWALEAENLLLHYSQRIKALSNRCRMIGKRWDSIRGLLGQEGRHCRWDGSFSVDETRWGQDELKDEDWAWSTEISWHAVGGVTHWQCLWSEAVETDDNRNGERKMQRVKLFR